MNKKLFIILLTAGVLVICVFGFLILSELLSDGARSPEEAVWKREKANMVYDVNDMVDYSSLMECYELNGRKKDFTRSTLKKDLKKIYSGKSPLYSEKSLSYEVTEKTFYNKDNDADTYDYLLGEYQLLFPDAKADEFCFVKINIFSEGRRILTYSAYTVKYGGRWYFHKV